MARHRVLTNPPDLVSPGGPNFCQGSPPPWLLIWFTEGCERIFQGFPPTGRGVGGGDGSPFLRQDQFVGVVGGNILNGEHLENLVGALAGNGSGGGKAEGGGLRIAATFFIHEHIICLQMIVVRQGKNNNKRSDNAIPTTTNGDDPSRI